MRGVAQVVLGAGGWTRCWRLSGRVLVAAAAVAAAATVEGQRAPRDVESRMWRGGVTGAGVVGGRVRTRSGQSLRDAVVALEHRDGAGRTRSTVSDERGVYRFDGVPVGRYRVVAMKAGFGRRYHGEDRYGESPASVEVGLGSVSQEVDIVLARGAVVAGRVQDDRGLAVPGAGVVLLQRVSRRGAVSLRVAGADVTDDRGAYRVFDLEPGAYYVRAENAPDQTVTVGEEEWSGNTGISVDGYAPSYYPGVTQLASARGGNSS